MKPRLGRFETNGSTAAHSQVADESTSTASQRHGNAPKIEGQIQSPWHNRHRNQPVPTVQLEPLVVGDNTVLSFHLLTKHASAFAGPKLSFSMGPADPFMFSLHVAFFGGLILASPVYPLLRRPICHAGAQNPRKEALHASLPFRHAFCFWAASRFLFWSHARRHQIRHPLPKWMG